MTWHNSIPRYIYTQEKWKLVLIKTCMRKKNLYKNVHSSVINNNQKVETTLMSISWQINKMWYIHVMGRVWGSKHKWGTDIFYKWINFDSDMDWKHDAKWNEPVMEYNVLIWEMRTEPVSVVDGSFLAVVSSIAKPCRHCWNVLQVFEVAALLGLSSCGFSFAL